jgi:hypothetical protein
MADVRESAKRSVKAAWERSAQVRAENKSSG